MNKITLYTAQSEQVAAVLEKDGVAYVKQAYIQDKYEESAWIFQEAYRYFVRTAQKHLPKPQEADSPYWLFADPQWARPEAGSVQLKLSVPEAEVLLFDRRTWGKILNLSLVGTEEEEQRFQEKLKKQGIMDSSEVFRTAFYPLLKQEILKSWDSLLTDDPGTIDKIHLQGAVWQLRDEWLVL